MNTAGFPLPPTHTKRTYGLSLGDLLDEEVVFAVKDGDEDRSHLDFWEYLSDHMPEKILWVGLQESRDVVTIEQPSLFEAYTMSVKDEQAILNLIGVSRILLDITGLPQHVWAPILKVARKHGIGVRVLYAEPEKYRSHHSPISATKFDLSETLEGLAPLPGFASLMGPQDEDKTIFIAFLGFEGNRPERLAVQVDPPASEVVPIIGLPGFRIEYPSYAVSCNRGLLSGFNAHSNIRFARASCPFEVYHILKGLLNDYPGYYFYLAIVGTKPHSLGAICFSIDNPENTELMFDHPVRRVGRTEGVSLIHIYDLNEML